MFGLSTRISVTWQGSHGRWFVRCCICGDDFWPTATAEEWALAITWAHDHGQEHRRLACPTCGHMKPIPECGHCGIRLMGAAEIGNVKVCHPPHGVWPDCYRLITDGGEPLGARKKQRVTA